MGPEPEERSYSFDKPRVDDIAARNTGDGGRGHVAYVYSVKNGVASLDEYNVASTGLFSPNRTTASNSANALSEFMHIGILPIWRPWEKLAAGLTAGAGVSSWAANRLDVFWVGHDSHLWHMCWNGSWHPAENLGSSLKGAVSSVSRGSNRIDIFAEGTDGNLWHKAWSGSWQPWQKLASEGSAPRRGLPNCCRPQARRSEIPPRPARTWPASGERISV